MGEEKTFHWDEVNWWILRKDFLKHIVYMLLAGISMFLLVKIYCSYHILPVYRSKAVFAVTMNADMSKISVSSLKTTKNMAKAFYEVFDSSVMEKEIQEDLGDLWDQVSFSVSLADETNLIQIFAEANNPKKAYEALLLSINGYIKMSEQLFSNARLELIQSPRISVFPLRESKTERYACLGGVIGFLFAACGFTFCSVFRKTIKTKAHAGRKLDGHYLGSLGHEKKKKSWKVENTKKGLLLTDIFVSLRFEQENYRLANQIEYLMKKQNKKILLVSSVMENEGKTTTAANLALCLARKNKKVMIIDCDLRKPSLYRIFEYSPEKFVDYLKYIEGKASIKDVVFQDKKRKIFVLCNSKSYSETDSILYHERWKQLLNGCTKIMDYIILDTAPIGSCSDTERIADLVDASVMVVRQDCADIRAINHASECLKTEENKFLGFVLNDYMGNKNDICYRTYDSLKEREW